MIIAAKAKAAIAVARTNATMKSDFQNLISELKRSNINVVGSVLNDPPIINVGP
jgi:Mrp family chromosome partitioning ATPase